MERKNLLCERATYLMSDPLSSSLIAFAACKNNSEVLINVVLARKDNGVGDHGYGEIHIILYSVGSFLQKKTKIISVVLNRVFQ